MGSCEQFALRRIGGFTGSLWFSVSTYLLPLFRFILGFRYLFGFRGESKFSRPNSSRSVVLPEEHNQGSSNYADPQPQAKPDPVQFDVVPQLNNQINSNCTDSESESEASGKNKDSGDDGFGEKETSSNFCFTFKFQTFEEFSRRTDESENGFMSEKGFSDFLEESHFSDNEREILEGGFLSEKGSTQFESESEAVSGETPGDSMEEQLSNEKNNFFPDDDLQFLSEREYFGSDSDTESLSSSDESSVESHFVDSSSNCDKETVQFQNLSFRHDRTRDANEGKKLRNFEEPSCSSDNLKNPNPQISSARDSEDPNRLETQWEHQELIEQLKMELKKARATGLPTILEESESPKTMMMEDLRPWKIQEKLHHENPLNELHKFYKSYTERMRKLDILNYQKMYAIGFLQLKDPFKSIPSRKSYSPAITAFLSQNLGLFRRKKIECDPSMKFITELYGDLEAVYVGHLCLSWEFLHWQYEKVIQLWESDPHGIRRYDEVAGEFQQFQVLMQRFIENEPFQGPRVENYVKTRCVLRSLLQVPLIKEDGFKGGKRGRRQKGNDGITCDVLIEIMEECIRIFWRFVRADKDPNVTQIELQDPSDPELLIETRTSLQKKEKKLRDLLRTGNCLLKRFQKHNQEDGSDQVLYFFSQVDMKLVSRVLNMSRITTDQLVWCRNKLSKINFVKRKIHVEPSFLLFPC